MPVQRIGLVFWQKHRLTAAAQNGAGIGDRIRKNRVHVFFDGQQSSASPSKRPENEGLVPSGASLAAASRASVPTSRDAAGTSACATSAGTGHSLRRMSRWIALALAMTPAASSAAPPTFERDIAPIVYQKCAPCHRPGEAGPFSLLSYADVKKRAGQIATVTRSGYMPPWLPERGYGDFADERRLTAEEIETIARWVSDGAPEGAPAGISPPQFTDGWQLGKPDLVLEAGGPFELPASGPDVYWNFIFTPGLTARRWVRAIEIRPGERRLVHHANLLVDRTGSARLQEPAPGKGFPGMDLVITRSPFDPDGHLLFWKPGSTPHVEPDGFAWRLDPGNELVLNAHLQPSGKPEQVRPSIGLYFTDRPADQVPAADPTRSRCGARHPGRARAISRSRTISSCRSMPIFWRSIRTLTTWGSVLEAWATLPDGSKKWLVLHSRLGPQLAGSLLLPRAAISAQGFGDPHAVPLRQLGGQRAQSQPSSAAWCARATRPPTR